MPEHLPLHAVSGIIAWLGSVDPSQLFPPLWIRLWMAAGVVVAIGVLLIIINLLRREADKESGL